jgi:hypothetical protein
MATTVSQPGTPGTTAADPGDAFDGAAARQETQAAFERALMDEYLREQGHTRHSMATLPPDRRAALLRGATAFATLRLAEIESRAHFVDEID